MFRTKTSAAGLSVLSNTLLIVLKLVAGILSGSVSIIAEAIHSANDLIAAIIAFFSVRIASRPADKDHPYGHGKVENISGTVEAILIFFAAGFIIYEAIDKMINGAEVKQLWLAIGVMAVSAIVNIFVSRHLLRVAYREDSIALEADGRHLTVDVYTSVGVMLGLLLVQLTGFHILDPVIAIAVALLILKMAYDLLRKAFPPLIDATLPEGEEQLIKSAIAEYMGHLGDAANFHELRTRKSGCERYIELHLVMSGSESIGRAHELCDHLEEDIKSKLPNAHVTIHVEPCDDECDECPGTCPPDEQTLGP
ncbi:MAG: cation diffusion facilitator family transporter [Chloroflexota bacterium]|nr:cation diffusion facilitator family transporter [Chloroflexota bacterium]